VAIVHLSFFATRTQTSTGTSVVLHSKVEYVVPTAVPPDAAHFWLHALQTTKRVMTTNGSDHVVGMTCVGASKRKSAVPLSSSHMWWCITVTSVSAMSAEYTGRSCVKNSHGWSGPINADSGLFGTSVLMHAQIWYLTS
jgi:hypothetical protein